MEASSASSGGASGGDANDAADGPSREEREVKRMRASVEVIAADGAVARSVLETVNGYTMTARAATEAVRKIMNAAAVKDSGGFHTSATLFGEDYIQTFDDLSITDL